MYLTVSDSDTACRASSTSEVRWRSGVRSWVRLSPPSLLDLRQGKAKTRGWEERKHSQHACIMSSVNVAASRRTHYFTACQQAIRTQLTGAGCAAGAGRQGNWARTRGWWSG